jgi:TatA/E family protein of Tat protein translocase
MFGTLGFSELIIILVIVLIIFGAGRLPQIGEGLGKALKGFKKEVHEVPPVDPNAGAVPPGTPPIEDAQVVPPQQPAQAAPSSAAPGAAPAPKTAPVPTSPYVPGPEATPGTTAALMAAAGPQQYVPPKPKISPQPVAPAPAASAGAQTAARPSGPSMEERQAGVQAPRAAYPAVPAAAQMKTPTKRPSAIVNKDAVARVQAQQAALREKSQQAAAPAPADMQSLGEGLGDALRTFRQAVADVRGAVDPQVRTIQAEIDSAQKEIEQTIETAKEMPAVQEDPPKQT